MLHAEGKRAAPRAPPTKRAARRAEVNEALPVQRDRRPAIMVSAGGEDFGDAEQCLGIGAVRDAGRVRQIELGTSAAVEADGDGLADERRRHDPAVVVATAVERHAQASHRRRVRRVGDPGKEGRRIDHVRSQPPRARAGTKADTEAGAGVAASERPTAVVDKTRATHDDRPAAHVGPPERPYRAHAHARRVIV